MRIQTGMSALERNSASALGCLGGSSEIVIQYRRCPEPMVMMFGGGFYASHYLTYLMCLVHCAESRVHCGGSFEREPAAKYGDLAVGGCRMVQIARRSRRYCRTQCHYYVRGKAVLDCGIGRVDGR